MSVRSAGRCCRVRATWCVISASTPARDRIHVPTVVGPLSTRATWRNTASFIGGLAPSTRHGFLQGPARATVMSPVLMPCRQAAFDDALTRSGGVMQPMPNAHAWNKLLKVSTALPCSGYDLVPDIANSDRTFDPLASAPQISVAGVPR